MGMMLATMLIALGGAMGIQAVPLSAASADSIPFEGVLFARSGMY
jgi:hypothetical protein